MDTEGVVTVLETVSQNRPPHVLDGVGRNEHGGAVHGHHLQRVRIILDDPRPDGGSHSRGRDASRIGLRLDLHPEVQPPKTRSSPLESSQLLS